MSEREKELLDVVFGERRRDAASPDVAETDGAGADPRAALSSEERVELTRLENDLERMTDLIDETHRLSGVREGALVGRVLAQTTREDLSWRGEAALVLRFVRERLAASAALRIVAASLLIHALALPVVGWILVYEKKPEPRIFFGVPLETGDGSPDESFAAEEVPVEPRTPRDEAARLLAGVENARRRARFVLSTRAGQVDQLESTERTIPEGDADALVIRLITARTRALETGAWEIWLDEAETADLDRVERVLWLEVLLDRVALEDVRPVRLTALLADLTPRTARTERDEDADESPSSRVAPFLDELEAMVLARARAYGVWPAPAGFDPLPVPLPLENRWFALLERALASGSEETRWNEREALQRALEILGAWCSP